MVLPGPAAPPLCRRGAFMLVCWMVRAHPCLGRPAGCLGLCLRMAAVRHLGHLRMVAPAARQPTPPRRTARPTSCHATRPRSGCVAAGGSVSYTHLTLPTNREV